MTAASSETCPAGRRGYPRPLLRRGGWNFLDGAWDFAIDVDARWRLPREVVWDREIQVPFAPETERSGIGDTGLYKACWYRRRATPARLVDGQRMLLHFGAVDYSAQVWVNGQFAASHEGGYTPFTVDVSPAARNGEFEIVVRAEDDPLDLAKPRGKQDWHPDPHAIWYPRTTGIWQPVWLEVVPATWIDRLRWTANLERWEIGCAVGVAGEVADGVRLSVRLEAGSQVIADDSYAVGAPELHRRIALSDPGIDDSRNELLWSPHSPTLVGAELCLRGPDGETIDRVESYTALRAVAIQGDRFVLNGHPFPLRLVLDQGYWPESGLTAPDDEALRRDVQLAKQMGFNGVRKHQKVEDPRYLYWADMLGLAVWAEMPSAYRFTEASIQRLTREWLDVVARDASHPCIVAWVPFNESWGVPNLPNSAAERHWVEALYHLTHTLDPSRPVVGNDGWESVATDLIGIHDYDANPARLAERYCQTAVRPRLLTRERPGGRMILLPEHTHVSEQHPIVLSEFGGMALVPGGQASDKAWGYSQCETPAQMEERYAALLRVVRSLEILTGFCYTQFTDTYQEANGLLYADRSPKIPLHSIAMATAGRLPREPLEPMLNDGQSDRS